MGTFYSRTQLPIKVLIIIRFSVEISSTNTNVSESRNSSGSLLRNHLYRGVWFGFLGDHP